jgi:radical SAM protein with 4Fe4S-binding SPASM domain
MFDYGPQISEHNISDRWYKQKTRMITRIQYRILGLFAKIPGTLGLNRIFSRISRKVVGGYLYSIKLEVNTACTLNCKMCYIHDSERELPLEIIKKLLDRVRNFRIRLEILGGEPLLRKDITEIIRYAKQASKLPFISLYTNGLFAEASMANALKTAGLDAAIVTLISHRPEVHDTFTGQQGSWSATVSNIANLKEAGITVYTFTAIHRDNYLDYQNIYYFVKGELKVDPLFYQYIPQKKEDPLMIPPAEWHTIKHWILLEKNREHADFVTRFYMLTGNACSGGNFVFTIKADGSVQPCPFISDLALGNIYESDIWEILQNRFDHRHLTEFKRVPAACQDCTYKSVCGGGCKAGNNLLYGSYNCRDHRCLGPYRDAIDRGTLVDRIPSFF